VVRPEGDFGAARRSRGSRRRHDGQERRPPAHSGAPDPDRGAPAISDQPAPCVFCAIAAGEAPATVVREWPDVIAIRPRGGVNAGHTLVIPRAHVADAGTDPEVSARTMACAAELMAGHRDANIITSKGSAATQTVFHLHLHVVPREAGDGLPLPWTPQQETAG
jgi:histidine triad (HIT) family protein